MTNIQFLYARLQEGKVSKEYFVRTARAEYSHIISPVNSYNDIVSILKSKRLIQEAHKLDTYQILDRLSPYAVKYGIECELSKREVLDDKDLEKIKAKVAKNLQKNPDYYREWQQANVKDIKKKDLYQDMEEVKSKNFKDKNNQMRKPKGYTPDKANTKASKKENRKGNPKGVKMMKEDVLPGTPMPQLANYNAGDKVFVPPYGAGEIKRVEGDTAYIDFDGSGNETPIQFSVLNKATEPLDKPELDPRLDWSQHTNEETKSEPQKIKEIVGKLKDYLKKKKGLEKENKLMRNPKTKKVASVGDDAASKSAASAMNYTQLVPGSVTPIDDQR